MKIQIGRYTLETNTGRVVRPAFFEIWFKGKCVLELRFFSPMTWLFFKKNRIEF